MPPRTLRVRVRDYGPGVPPEALPRIFDPFYRVEATAGAAPAVSASGSPSPAAPPSCTRAGSLPATPAPAWSFCWNCRRPARRARRPAPEPVHSAE